MAHEQFIFFNGEIVDRELSLVHIDYEDRGYNFGDGVYEVIRVYGGQFYTLDEHMTRLYRSANEIHVDLPYSQEEFTAKLEELLKVNNFTEDGMIYLQVTRGAAPRNHTYDNLTPVIFAYVKKFPRPLDKLEHGVSAYIANDVRWLRCDIKSLNLLPNIMAKQEAANNGCFEAILHRDGVVTEGSASNVYMVQDGIVFTHPAGNLILNGITRNRIEALCNENEIPFVETAFHIPHIFEAEEMFLTSTTSEVMPITKVNGEWIADGKVGPVTRQLQQLLEKDANLSKDNISTSAE